ncbi:MAG: hypothetical protein QNK03_02585 [Myxococcota bacterium]|nr:hypothetical protein [Myxococcota bacterium]
MTEPLAVTLLLGGVRLYLALGAAFALAFALFGVQRVDPTARHGSIGFRLVILPGVALLWPLLALRWWRGAGPPAECNAHRIAARARSES